MKRTYLILMVLFLCPAFSRADEVILSNGDKITGTVGTIAGGKMKFTSPALGEITIDMDKVKSYTTEKPADIRLKAVADKKQAVVEPISGATPDTVTTKDGRKIPMADVKQINPPAETWTGAVVLNGMLTNGNSHSYSLGFTADATLRRDHADVDDRFSLGAGYHFGRDRNTDSGDMNTTSDDWFAQAKYDNFWTEKLYGYALMRVDHDNIADLNYRLAPGVGIGYQWIEKPNFNFSTEAGFSYVYEDYSNDGTEEHVAVRLAYHVDKKLNDTIALFHNLEYLPAIDDPSDYNLNADAGIRAKLTKTFFSELKVEWRRDSTPSEGNLKNDLRFLLGLGWAF